MGIFIATQAGGLSGCILIQLQDADNGDIVLTKEQGAWFGKCYCSWKKVLSFSTPFLFILTTASTLFVGAIPGSIVTGFQVEYFGRKLSLLIGSFGLAVGNVIVASATSFEQLLVGRCILGWAFGGQFVHVPIYTSEISQPVIRQLTGALAAVSATSGFAMSYIIGALVDWRMLVWVNAVICVALLFLQMLLLKESHVWLFSKGKISEANQALMELRGNEEVAQEEIDLIRWNVEEREKANKASSDISKVQMLKDLLGTGTFVRPFLVSLAVRVWGCDMIGVQIIALYLGPLIIQSHVPLDAKWVAAALTVYRAIASAICTSCITRVKRVPVCMSAMFVAGLGMLCLGLNGIFNDNGELNHLWSGIKYLPMLGFILFYTAFAMGICNIIIMIPGEIMPSNARGIGCGMINFIHNITQFLTTVMVPTVQELIGTGWMFTLCAIAAFGMIIFAFFCIPETFGKSLEEIEEHYRRVCYGDLEETHNETVSYISEGGTRYYSYDNSGKNDAISLSEISISKLAISDSNGRKFNLNVSGI